MNPAQVYDYKKNKIQLGVEYRKIIENIRPTIK
jgi:hypothetical protein